jgi:acetyl esterase
MAIDPNQASLDPQAKGLLDFIAQAGRIPYSQITPPMARAQMAELLRRTKKNAEWAVSTRDLDFACPAGKIRARLYTPRAATAPLLPVTVFFHGGGWCIGDIDTHDPVCRQLAEEAECAVLSIDYRLAPEHRFPAAVEDCFAAVRFVAAEGKSLGLDPARIAVAGDSAGGNLSAVSAILARDVGVAIAAQVLIYPATDWVGTYASRKDYAEGFLLTEESMNWFGNNYIDAKDHGDFRASPILARDLSRLPPALVLCGGCDPLLGESRAYAEKLRAAGTESHFSLYPGQIHAFFNMGGVIGAADKAMAEIAAFLKRVFAR